VHLFWEALVVLKTSTKAVNNSKAEVKDNTVEYTYVQQYQA